MREKPIILHAAIRGDRITGIYRTEEAALASLPDGTEPLPLAGAPEPDGCVYAATGCLHVAPDMVFRLCPALGTTAEMALTGLLEPPMPGTRAEATSLRAYVPGRDYTDALPPELIGSAGVQQLLAAHACHFPANPL